jgi:hypothetical protein
MSVPPSQVSTIAPSDSVSNVPETSTPKKSRPGKNARAKAKSEAPKPSSKFSAKSSVPDPQPGKFPVVFATGSGEATRDVEIAYRPATLVGVLTNFDTALSFHPKYAEFSQHSGFDTPTLRKWLVTSGLMFVCQHTLWSHVKLGLPVGDFGSIGSTDLKILRSETMALSQLGEFSADELGSRYLLADYPATISSLVRCARGVYHSTGTVQAVRQHLESMWLPVSNEDRRTRFLLSRALSNWVSANFGLHLSTSTLMTDIWSGTVPAWWTAVKTLIPQRPGRFDFLFDALTTDAAFATEYGSQNRLAILQELGFFWTIPHIAASLRWNSTAKTEFSSLADQIARATPALAKFFSLVSSQTLKAEAVGKRSQLSMVEEVLGVTVVSAKMALSAPDLSLLSCFPAEVVVDQLDPYQVRATTSIPIGVRRTEFIQLDYLS